MTHCYNCCAKIVRQLWIVDSKVYCSPFCERATWDNKSRKWTTKFSRFGDKQIENFGVAGLVKEKRK